MSKVFRTKETALNYVKTHPKKYRHGDHVRTKTNKVYMVTYGKRGGISLRLYEPKWGRARPY